MDHIPTEKNTKTNLVIGGVGIVSLLLGLLIGFLVFKNDSSISENRTNTEVAESQAAQEPVSTTDLPQSASVQKSILEICENTISEKIIKTISSPDKSQVIGTYLIKGGGEFSLDSQGVFVGRDDNCQKVSRVALQDVGSSNEAATYVSNDSNKNLSVAIHQSIGDSTVTQIYSVNEGLVVENLGASASFFIGDDQAARNTNLVNEASLEWESDSEIAFTVTGFVDGSNTYDFKYNLEDSSQTSFVKR